MSRRGKNTVLRVGMVAAAAFWVGALVGQQPHAAKSAEFEVASIKPGDPKLGVASSTSGGLPGGQYRMVNVPLKQWVEMGLGVRDYALRGPAWLDTARFDLNARVPSGAVDPNARAEMMKALLIERFGLKWHEESGTVAGYELVPDKKVLLKPATLLERLRGDGGAGAGPTLINGTNMTMAELAGKLGEALGKPVVDATHLEGGYDIVLRWRPLDEAAVAEQKKYDKQNGFDVDSLPGSMFTAIREQLGLRLQSAKVPSKVIVVDQINRQPSGN